MSATSYRGSARMTSLVKRTLPASSIDRAGEERLSWRAMTRQAHQSGPALPVGPQTVVAMVPVDEHEIYPIPLVPGPSRPGSVGTRGSRTHTDFSVPYPSDF